MKFVRGGDLFQHLKKEKRLSEERSKFYSFVIALAIGHLHSQNIIHRDLKPENVLIGEDGYIYLSDFGIAKTLKKDEVTHSFCGTPDYIAPEIINKSGHSF